MGRWSDKEITKGMCVLCLVTQSCPTLWNLMDCSPLGSSVHGDSPGKNIGVGCHALLQGIFPTQGSNPHLLRLLCCRWILYPWATRKKESGSEVAQSCPTLCDPMDGSLPGSAVHGILQARILEWLPFPSPGDLPNPGIKPGSPALQIDALPSEPPGKPQIRYGQTLLWNSNWFYFWN